MTKTKKLSGLPRGEKKVKKHNESIEDELDEYSRATHEQISDIKQALLRDYSEQLPQSEEVKPSQPVDAEYLLFVELFNKALELFKKDCKDDNKYRVLVDTFNNNPNSDEKSCLKIATEKLYCDLITYSITKTNNKIKKLSIFKIIISFNDERRVIDEIKSSLLIITRSSKHRTTSVTQCCNKLDDLYNKSKKLEASLNDKIKNEIKTFSYFIIPVIIAIVIAYLTIH
jgi:hypothetical protein